ncbi:MAG: hypothetical protein WAT22_02075 [Saprospiraceae bacterium]
MIERSRSVNALNGIEVKEPAYGLWRGGHPKIAVGECTGVERK